MKTNSLLRLAALWLLTAGFSFTTTAQVPQLLHYQGRTIVANTNFEGPGLFKFALVNGAGNLTYWSNDGSSTTGNEPGNGVSLPVTKGLYALLLGDTSLPNMTAIPSAVFVNADVRLRVWFNDGAQGYQQVAPDQRIAAVGYSMIAASVPDSAITADKLAPGQAVKSLNTLKDNVNLVPGANVTITPSGNNLEIAATGGATGWGLAGNGGTTAANFLGTTDNQPVELKVNSERAFRLQSGGAVAAGRRAWANHPGTFAWADATDADFASSGSNQFIIRASGGVGINTPDPAGAALRVNGTITALNLNLTSSEQSPVSISGDHMGGTWFNLANTSLGGRTWNLISSGSDNGEGPGKLLFRDPTQGVLLALSTNGLMGVGTTSPAEKLHVSGKFLRVDGLADEQAYFGGDGVAEDVQLGSLNPGITNISLWNPTLGMAMNLSVNRLTVNELNLVGGTTISLTGGVRARGGPPGAGGVENNGFAFNGNGGDNDSGMFSTADGQVEFYANAQERMRISPDGSVGIGTDNPQSRLDVAGTVEMDGLRLNAASLAGAVMTATDGAGNGGWNNLLLHESVSRGLFPNIVDSVNFKGGAVANSIGAGVIGATVLGGGRSTQIISPGSPPEWPNRAAADFAAVLGGAGNLAGGAHSFVGGGFSNNATGGYAAVVGGRDNLAGGDYSFAAGRGSQASHSGAFVWSDADAASFGSTGDNQFLIRASGGVGIGTTSPQAALDVAGTTRTCVLTIIGGCDLAEPFPMKEQDIPKGSVVVIDEEHPGRLMRSASAYDRRVAGIISGANGVNPGITLQQEGAFADGQNVALTGRVYVLADANTGAIKPGDLLTTSHTPGHAMRVADHTRAPGAVLGKAMSSLPAGKGMVLVLVSLQ